MIRVIPALRALGLVALTLPLAASVQAGTHTWDVSEVFSNADGTIQFIELKDVGVGGNETGVGNGTISSDTQTHSWSNGPVTAPTNGKFYLIATPDFAALPGVPTPDVIIPAGKVPFFSTGGDSVDFSIYDTCTFASAPANGYHSLDCLSNTTTVNSPTNYAGATTTVNLAPSAPTLAPAMQWVLVGLLLTAGAGVLLLRRPQRV